MCANIGNGIHDKCPTVLSTIQFSPVLHHLCYGRHNALRGTFAALGLIPLFTLEERLSAGWADVVTSTSGVREELEAAVTGC